MTWQGREGSRTVTLVIATGVIWNQRDITWFIVQFYEEKTLISMRHGTRMKKMMICIELRGQTPISSLPYHEVNMTTGENIIYCTAVSFMKILLSQWGPVLPGGHCWDQNNGLLLCSQVSATQFWRSCTRKWNLPLLNFASELQWFELMTGNHSSGYSNGHQGDMPPIWWVSAKET